METGRLLRLIEELAELNVFDIVIAGGEPFLHPSLPLIIRKSVETRLQTAVLTNGILVTDRVASELAGIVAGRRFILQISLDSYEPRVHDLTRGKGEDVIRNIRFLSTLGIELQLSCVLSKHNVETAHRVIDHFYPSVKRFHFLNIQHTEMSLKHPELLLSDEECSRFWSRLNEHVQRFPADLFIPSLRVMMRVRRNGVDEGDVVSARSRATFDCASCSAGITHVNIDADFNVLGCDIAKDFTCMGNVRDESFVSVWNSARAQTVRDFVFPACYRIRGPDGSSLADHLKPQYRAAVGCSR